MGRRHVNLKKERVMDFMAMGIESLEAAMNASYSITEKINSIIQIANEPENPPITCEISRCDW